MLVDGVWIENAVRFPIERRVRPSYAMMCDLAPDEGTIPLIVEALAIQDYDPDLRDRADCEMAQYLATIKLPDAPDARRGFLEGLSQQALQRAILASIEARRTADETYRACRIAIEARDSDPRNSAGFAYRANVSARAALEAHRLCQIARGKCRAITLAAMSVPWTAFETHEATLWLIHRGAKPACAPVRGSADAR